MEKLLKIIREHYGEIVGLGEDCPNKEICPSYHISCKEDYFYCKILEEYVFLNKEKYIILR